MKKVDFFLIGIILVIIILQINSVLGATKGVCNNVGAAACDYVEVESCLIGINNSGDICNLVQGNGTYVFNNTYTTPAFNLTPEYIFYAINISNSSIYLDMNYSSMWGNTTGYGIFINGSQNFNFTLMNATISGFQYGLHIEDTTNVTINNCNISNNNATGNRSNLYMSKVDNVIIKNSIFSGSADGSGIYAKNGTNNTYIYNITIDHIGQMNGDQYGIYFIDHSANGWGTNLTITNSSFNNNSFNLMVIGYGNVTIKGNYFGNITDGSLEGHPYNASVGLFGMPTQEHSNINIINNTFNSSGGTQLALSNYFKNYQNISNITITNNTFYDTKEGSFDIHVFDEGHFSNTIYLNTFVKGIIDLYGNNSFCGNSEGNYYNQSILIKYRGNLTKAPLNAECGLMNLTQLDGDNIIINGTNPFDIQWDKQSSKNALNYTIYYMMINGSAWNFLGSTTTGTNFTWDLSAVNDSNDYLVKVVAFDGLYNSTIENSTITFTIDNTNPSISLSPSSDASLNIGSTQSISCSASDSLGMSSTAITIGGTTWKSGISSVSGDYIFGSSASKTVTCTVIDLNGRTNTKSITLSYLGGGGGGDSGGSGGGSGVARRWDIDFTKVKEGTLSGKEGVTKIFTLDGSTSHSIKFNKIGLVSITLIVKSNPITVDLILGQSKKLDLDNDGTNEIKITLQDISGKEAKIKTEDLQSTLITLPSKGVGDIIPLTIAGESYELAINEVGLTSTQITLADKTINLMLGETKSVDLNNDGANDIEITLTSVTDKIPLFTIKDMSSEPEVIADAIEEISKLPSKTKIGLLALGLVLLIVLIIYIIEKRIHK